MASSDFDLDLEEDHQYLQGFHSWEVVREGVNRLEQEWQEWKCVMCHRRGVAVQGILRPPGWTPIRPPEKGCKPRANPLEQRIRNLEVEIAQLKEKMV